MLHLSEEMFILAGAGEAMFARNIIQSGKVFIF
jgi:hypothetical protein